MQHTNHEDEDKHSDAGLHGNKEHREANHCQQGVRPPEDSDFTFPVGQTGNALSLIVGSLIGVLAYYVSYRLGGYEGALLGLALIPALVVIPAAIMLIKRGVIPLSYLKPSWDNVR